MLRGRRDPVTSRMSRVPVSSETSEPSAFLRPLSPSRVQSLPRIFDNKTEPLAPALRETLDQAVALDACVGYLNLRGWHQIADSVETLDGKAGRPPARVL